MAFQITVHSRTFSKTWTAMHIALESVVRGSIFREKQTASHLVF